VSLTAEQSPSGAGALRGGGAKPVGGSKGGAEKLIGLVVGGCAVCTWAGSTQR